MRRQEQFKTSTYCKLLRLSLGTLLLALTSSGLQADADSSSRTNSTTIYKVPHPDGSVSYSDQAQANATKIRVEPVSTVPAVKPLKMTSTATASSDQPAYYHSLLITKPAHGSAFHSGDGNISVSTKIEPALRAKDRLRFILNGSEIQTQNNGSLQLTNLNRGIHQLQVQVLDPQNSPLISASSEFTIHRPIARSFKAN